MSPRLHTVFALLFLLAAPARAAVDRNLSDAWPGGEVRAVWVEVPAGELVVVPSGDSQVRVSVALEARNLDLSLLRLTRGRAQSLVAGAALDVERRAAGLRLAVRYPGPAADHVLERWRLELPVDTALNARVNAGDISVRDIAGGLELDVNVGQVRVDVMAGTVRARVNVGDILLDSRAEHFGTVILQSNVGDAVVDLLGRIVPPERTLPPGAFMRLQGDGEDPYVLVTNVGDVRFNLRRP